MRNPRDDFPESRCDTERSALKRTNDPLRIARKLCRHEHASQQAQRDSSRDERHIYNLEYPTKDNRIPALVYNDDLRHTCAGTVRKRSIGGGHGTRTPPIDCGVRVLTCGPKPGRTHPAERSKGCPRNLLRTTCSGACKFGSAAKMGPSSSTKLTSSQANSVLEEVQPVFLKKSMASMVCVTCLEL